MGKTEGKKDYFSFVLRLWRAGNDKEPVWRASLNNALTQELLGFAGLKEMCAYLEAQIKEANLSSKESPDESRLILESPREENEGRCGSTCTTQFIQSQQNRHKAG